MTYQRNDPTPGAWKRVVTPGTHDYLWAHRTVTLFVEIEWRYDMNQKWELSICGTDGPKVNGDAYGSSGQCRDVLDDELAPLDGWDRPMIERLREVWDRWHLNGMRAGSPNQEEWKRANPYDRERHGHDHYAWIKGALAQAGLDPDPNFALADGKPYSYGSAWLYEEVPTDVLDWLRNLPPAVKAHPWGDHDYTTEET
jgi:hypothetical protein